MYRATATNLSQPANSRNSSFLTMCLKIQVVYVLCGHTHRLSPLSKGCDNNEPHREQGAVKYLGALCPKCLKYRTVAAFTNSGLRLMLARQDTRRWEFWRSWNAREPDLHAVIIPDAITSDEKYADIVQAIDATNAEPVQDESEPSQTESAPTKIRAPDLVFDINVTDHDAANNLGYDSTAREKPNFNVGLRVLPRGKPRYNWDSDTNITDSERANRRIETARTPIRRIQDHTQNSEVFGDYSSSSSSRQTSEHN